MLHWALTFFVLAIMAGLLGFTGVAASAVGIARFIFNLFLVLFLISLVARFFTDTTHDTSPVH